MQLTVTIPDDLARKVAAHRLNVAGLGEAALRRRVARIEACAACPDDLSATIARLRPRHDARFRKAEELGFAAGVAYAKTEATPAELEAIDRWSDPNVPHHGLPKKAHQVEYAVVIREGNGRLDGVAYLRGWHLGLLGVWPAVKERL